MKISRPIVEIFCIDVEAFKGPHIMALSCPLKESSTAFNWGHRHTRSLHLLDGRHNPGPVDCSLAWRVQPRGARAAGLVSVASSTLCRRPGSRSGGRIMGCCARAASGHAPRHPKHRGNLVVACSLLGSGRSILTARTSTLKELNLASVAQVPSARLMTASSKAS